jgi:hypothetical protein
MQNWLEWDIIPMNDTALAATSDATVEACQSTCSGAGDCQYFEFYPDRAPGARCRLRNTVPYAAVNASDATQSYAMFEVRARAAPAWGWPGGSPRPRRAAVPCASCGPAPRSRSLRPAQPHLAPRPRACNPAPPQVQKGSYVAFVAHPTDAASLGSPLAAYATRAEAEAACNVVAACVGFKFVHTDATLPWKTFSAIKWGGVVGKVRAVGENINPWIPDPRG